MRGDCFGKRFVVIIGDIELPGRLFNNWTDSRIVDTANLWEQMVLDLKI